MQSGGTRDRGVNIVSVPTKSGRLATMNMEGSMGDSALRQHGSGGGSELGI